MRDRLVPMGYFNDLADARKSLRENSLIALETHLDLLSWMKTETAREDFQNFMEYYGFRKLTDQPRREYLGGLLRESVEHTLSGAQTFFVSKDMTEIISQASDDLGRFQEEGLSPADLPSERGFVVFDHPIVLEAEEYDIDRLEPGGIPLAGFAWENAIVGGKGGQDEGRAPGIEYFLFLWPEDVLTMAAAHDDPSVNDVTLPEVRKFKGPFPVYDFSGWKYGTGWETALAKQQEGERDEEGKLLVAPIVAATRRVLLTTFKMLNEKVTALETERPYRALRRRAQGIVPSDGDVVVVRLRKEYNPTDKYKADHGEDDEQVPWYNHRFLVRGHWKRQSYGVGRTQSKLIWVMPYIKGPEDQPLVIKDRVFSLEH